MKANIIGVIIALALAFAGAIGALAQNAKVSEVRKVEDFSSLKITSVASVYFVQGDRCSVRLEGKEKWVKLTTTEVEDGCLTIAFKKGGKNHKGNIDGLKIFVTAPTLEAATLAGVGGFKCEEPLKLDDFTLKVTGVGSAEISHLTCRNLFVGMSGVGEAVVNVDCDYLKAGMSGVGSLELSGCAGKADISRGGIGSVNTKHLKIKNEE